MTGLLSELVLVRPGEVFPHCARPLRSLWNGTINVIVAVMDASGNGIIDAITPGQLRAARGLIGWSQEQLVERSGVPKRTIARLELGEGTPQRRTLAAIRTALEAAGIEFVEQNGGGPGVRLKDRQI